MRPLSYNVDFTCSICMRQHNGTLELDNIIVVDAVPPSPGLFDFYYICPTNNTGGRVSINLDQNHLEYRYATLKIGSISVHDDALIQFGKNTIVGSLEYLRNFVSMMV